MLKLNLQALRAVESQDGLQYRRRRCQAVSHVFDEVRRRLYDLNIAVLNVEYERRGSRAIEGCKLRSVTTVVQLLDCSKSRIQYSRPPLASLSMFPMMG